MKQIFLAPRSDETSYENFQSTIAKGVDYEKIVPFLTENEKQVFKDQKKLFIWGAQPRVKDKWEKIKSGDYVLFYEHYNFIIAAEVQLKKYSDEMALTLWPESKDTGSPWSCLYVVNNMRPIDLPITKLNDVTGYNMQYLRGFQRISDEPLSKIIAAYGSTNNFIEAITKGLKDHEVAELNGIAGKEPEEISSDEIEKLDSIFGDRDPEEVLAELSTRNMDRSPEQVTVQQRRIRRDYKLVKAIKEKFQNKCQFCGFTFKTSTGNYYSEAAHIKPISTRTVGVDIADNILILCPNHHKMLDNGAIEIISSKEYVLDGEKITLP